MRRRDIIAGLGAMAATPVWPLAARAQRTARVRRVGLLMGYDEDDPVGKDLLSWFTWGLAEGPTSPRPAPGWTVGRDVMIDVRWGADNVGRTQKLAKELVDLQPEVIVVNSASATKALQQQTQNIPVVFLSVADDSNGIVGNISRPDGNITGVAVESTVGGKWLSVLRDAAPRLARVALLFNPELADGEAYFPSIAEAAAQYNITTIRAPVRDARAIERAIEAAAAEPNGGLILVPPPLHFAHRELIIRLAVRHRLPAICQDRHFADEGGLMCYGVDEKVVFRFKGPFYVGNILHGTKVSELPVQLPNHELKLVINAKTAKAIGLDIPPVLLGIADDLIE